MRQMISEITHLEMLFQNPKSFQEEKENTRSTEEHVSGFIPGLTSTILNATSNGATFPILRVSCFTLHFHRQLKLSTNGRENRFLDTRELRMLISRALLGKHLEGGLLTKVGVN